jgi:uncharacterized membrane protein HdeD (DUF308 family)
MSLSSSLLWRGLLAIGVGIVSVAWPSITLGAFVILFAVYAFIAAGTDAMRGFSSDSLGPVAGYLLLALLSVAAGLVGADHLGGGLGSCHRLRRGGAGIPAW